MNPEYIKSQLKSLKIDVSLYRTREEKLATLEAFRIGFEQQLSESYPQRFNKPEGAVQDKFKDRYYHPRGLGERTALDLDELSVEGMREQILAELEKRKTRLTQTRVQRFFKATIRVLKRLEDSWYEAAEAHMRGH